MPRKSCTECGARSKLHVHHKDRNPANNSTENLVVLCASYHLKLHWHEDRSKRIGALMGQRYAAGKSALVAKPQPRSN
ncbi:HNH endonuclease signature motif containing protein [Sinomonas terricola]|uniref:HNH endonuclease signature motif containing protein n=1 Tax=Sinomonas terricola TaxID=3110330 RepID=UPI003D17D29F